MLARLIPVLALWLFAGERCLAQLPTASGRQIGLSQPQWKLFVPDGYAHRQGGEVDLLVHFHGDPQTVWNNAAYAELNAVIVTANYNGLSSAYSTPFSNPALFQTLLDDSLATLVAQPDFSASTAWDRIAVSSFSAGYGAVRQLLSVPSYFNAIDSLLAADSLYATTAGDGTALDSQMVGYKAFADAAAAGQKQFIFSHSQVQTYTYESTAETGDELLAHLGLSPTASNATGLGDLDFYRTASMGNFELWGALGATGDDHLSHLRYIGEWLDDLGLSGQSLPGDFNNDGAVDAADYTVWRDGLRWVYTLDQFDVWAGNYGSGVPPETASIPEPTAALLAAWLAAALVRRRV